MTPNNGKDSLELKSKEDIFGKIKIILGKTTKNIFDSVKEKISNKLTLEDYNTFFSFVNKYNIEKYKNISFEEFLELKSIDFSHHTIKQGDIEELKILRFIEAGNFEHCNLSYIPYYLKKNKKLKEALLFYNNIPCSTINYFCKHHKNDIKAHKTFFRKEENIEIT